MLKLAIVFLGGAALAAALPPWNWNILAFLTLIPVWYFSVERNSIPRAALFGWVWGLGWSIFSFRFLREIAPPIPWALAPVMALWPAVFAAALPFLWNYLVFPFADRMKGEAGRTEVLAHGIAPGRLLAFLFLSTAWFVTVESTNSRLFPWNGIEVTAWQNLPLLQTAAVTGGYGIAFVIVLVNAGAAIFLRSPRRNFAPALALGILAAVSLAGAWKIYSEVPPKAGDPGVRLWRAVLLQGDISQRRAASREAALEAIDVYAALSREAIRKYPDADVIVWPESAVPVAYRSPGPLGTIFRGRIAALSRQTSSRFLLGALDYIAINGPEKRYGESNSALLIAPGGRIEAKYDKIHRVPFGEYIPFRRWLPEWLVKHIDMQRDLTPGNNYRPFEFSNGVRVGTAICFESIFGYLGRSLVRNGANVIFVLSNDAWYPESSEPEQHLANAITRAVETGLYIVRCGNNGGSLVINPQGKPEQILEVPGTGAVFLRRGRGMQEVAIPVRLHPEPTFFVRYGQWFVWFCVLFAGIGFAVAFREFYRDRKYFYGLLHASASSVPQQEEPPEEKTRGLYDD